MISYCVFLWTPLHTQSLPVAIDGFGRPAFTKNGAAPPPSLSSPSRQAPFRRPPTKELTHEIFWHRQVVRHRSGPRRNQAGNRRRGPALRQGRHLVGQRQSPDGRPAPVL